MAFDVEEVVASRDDEFWCEYCPCGCKKFDVYYQQNGSTICGCCAIDRGVIEDDDDDDHQVATAA